MGEILFVYKIPWSQILEKLNQPDDIILGMGVGEKIQKVAKGCPVSLNINLC